MRLIAQISDLHFGRHDLGVVEALLASLAERAPDLIAVSGDFTQRARRAEFVAARHFLDRIVQPKVVVPGNHDVPLYALHLRLFSPFTKFDRYIRPAGVPGGFFVDDEIAVLGLNTARRLTIKDGRVSFEQMAEIRSTFDRVRPEIFKVIVTHHPLGSPSDDAPVVLAGRATLALQAIVASGVHLLLSGHHHQASSGEVDVETAVGKSVLIMHAGTAISTRHRGSEGNTYNLIRIDGDALTLTVMEHRSPDGFREGHAASYRFEHGIWQPH
jgi:3',5'-cyclic AMP phosphodiesterase CpdA